VTLDPNTPIIREGAIGIENDHIEFVGTSEEATKLFSATKILDVEGRTIYPGLINTHTHLFQTLFKGLGSDVHLFQWFGKALAPFIPFLTEEDCYAAALLGCVEAIKSGATTVLDFMYAHPRPDLSKAIIRAMEDTGIRGIFARGIVDSGRDLGLPEEMIQNLDEAIEDTEKLFGIYHNYNGDRIRVWVAPSSIWMATPRAFSRAKELADRHNSSMTWHASESRSVIDYAKSKYSKTDLDLLKGMVILSKNVLAAHCVWVDDNDIELLRTNSVKVSHCPVANMYLSDGVAPIPRMLRSGVTVGLGTDGAASNDNQDMLSVLKFTALLHKVHNQDPAIITSSQVLNLATCGGGRERSV
jgi:5-methylthioadenosine/S-adenosylhomocysteine deaminase